MTEPPTPTPLTVLDLFCGCGGTTKGLTDAGLNVIAGIDIWEKAVDNYNKNFQHHKAYARDLTKLSPAHFCELYTTETGKTIPIFDIIVSTAPCQSYSLAGKRDTNDPRNSLFMEFIKYLDYFAPRAFMMENVIGLLSKKTDSGEKVIDIIMSHLNKNYSCIICKLYASDFEVPQNRRRVIIIGIRKDLGMIPTEPRPVITDRIPVKNVLLPREEISPEYFLSERALTGIAAKREKSKARGAGFGAQFLDMEKPSYTIPARYYKNGSDALVKYSETEVRRLTITELKRIQSFPDDYILEGSKKDIIIQIGNAVAPRFAYHLGRHIQSFFV